MKLIIALNQRIYIKKNSKRLIQRGARKFFVPSLNYELFQRRALEEIGNQMTDGFLPPTPLFTGYTHVHSDFYVVGRTRVDPDGMQTSILDILQDARIIHDDNEAIKGSYFKHLNAPEFKAVITITSINGRGDEI